MSDTNATNILDQVKARLGARWDEITEADRQLVARCASDAAALQLQALTADPNDPAAVAFFEGEKRQIDAQLANIQSVAAREVQAAFWDGVRTVGDFLVTRVAPMLLKIGLATIGVPPGVVDAAGAVAGLAGQQFAGDGPIPPAPDLA